MMKILSFITFVILLSWSWQVVHSSAPVDFETHSDIQQKLIELIQNTIKSKKPQVKDVEIIKMWTQGIAERKIKAFFSYHFTEPGTGTVAGTENGTGSGAGAESGSTFGIGANQESIERTIEGEAILVRELSDNPSVDKWTMQSLQTKGDNISFNDGSLITPDNQSSDENPSSINPQTPTSENPMAPETKPTQ